MRKWQEGDHVTVTDYPGIAFFISRWETKPDEDTEWTGIEEPTGNVEIVMVGDDRVFVYDPEDLTALDEGDYCPSCGQIGCHAYPQ